MKLTIEWIKDGKKHQKEYHISELEAVKRRIAELSEQHKFTKCKFKIIGSSNIKVQISNEPLTCLFG